MDYTAAAKDFRRFVKELEDEGELVTVTKEVDPHLEVGAIVRKVYETEERAPLFTNVKGRKTDGLFRILGASVGCSKRPGMRYCRLAKSIGLPSSATGQDIVAKINEAKSKPPVPCRQVETGPIKDHILLGDEIDLTKLPVPLLHEHDGGKYLATMGMHVVQSPDGRWTNWAISRGMVLGKRELAGLVIPKQDIGTIWNLWKEKGEDMPWALCFGVPPAAIVVGGMPIPKWTNEPDFIGALTGAPVEVVKCETNDLLVPANAEIVLEGVVSVTETVPEGPMVEYNGMVYPGRAADEGHTIWSTTQAAEVLNICQAADLPIKMVWSPFESHSMWFAIQVDRQKLVKMQTNMEDFCRRLGHVVFSSKPGWFIPKIFLVGDYIDPTNLLDVIYAEASRCEPGRHEFVFFEYSNIPLIPYVEHGFPSESGTNGKVVKCCMLPEDFTEETLPWKGGSFEEAYPETVKQTVLDNWTAYGF
ncbi:3-octaprenyl-4-hydroxybenzoate carboxy-lyase-domain-containing protein [Aspergillus avenaceus]|uniref:Ferulic acid decarboxylase 1 n=1 Tax=Aspergillus avenaceus TaxID=36643 RepID=A0A5N6TPG1_ASPAV|nr:3-octaprenyl-4-hydroxybenzoate carboxy-lyase-domain-containing protein [Aspergillus avenaceus]